MTKTCQTCGKPPCGAIATGHATCEYEQESKNARPDLCHGHEPEAVKPSALVVKDGFADGGNYKPKADEWEERFDDKVNEVETANEYTEEPVDFGFRKVLRDEHGNDNLISATDWGNVKSFIRQVAAQARETALSVPMGVSQWLEHGKKYGYDIYFIDQAKAEGAERVVRAIHKKMKQFSSVRIVSREEMKRCKFDILKAERDRNGLEIGKMINAQIKDEMNPLTEPPAVEARLSVLVITPKDFNAAAHQALQEVKGEK